MLETVTVSYFGRGANRAPTKSLTKQPDTAHSFHNGSLIFDLPTIRGPGLLNLFL